MASYDHHPHPGAAHPRKAPPSRPTVSRCGILISALAIAAITPPSQGAEPPPHVVLIAGDAEYGSRTTCARIEERLRMEFGFRTTLLRSMVGVLEGEDNPDKSIPGLEVIRDADLLIIYVRMRIPPRAQLEMLDEYFESGKPAIAMRTTTHGFTNDRGWCPRYFGGHYWGHFGGQTETFAAPAHIDHPVLRGVPRHEVHEGNSLYLTSPLSDTATPLVLGRRDDVTPAQAYAWVNEYKKGQRIFCFTASHPEDFDEVDNQLLLYNAVLWGLGREVPPSGALEIPTVTAALKSSEVSYPPPPPQRSTPPGATALFDGNDLRAWDWWCGAKGPPYHFGIDDRAHSLAGLPEFAGARWPIKTQAVVAQPGYGDLVSRESFTDFRLQLDFLIPESPPDIKRIWRGNSGVYLGGRYEIQILDTPEEEPTPTSCGAIVGQTPPATNACKPAGEWQQLEVIFRAARFQDGRKISSARLTADLNGKRIHDNVEVSEETGWGFSERVEESAEGEDGPLAGPLRLQADTSPVRFANVFVERLAEEEIFDLLPRRRPPTGQRWIDMDYGQFLTSSYEVEEENIACKGIAIRVDGSEGGLTSGSQFLLFDTDTLRFAGGWFGSRFVDWRSIGFDGSHGTHMSVVGQLFFSNPVGPGWGRPGDQSFADERFLGKDGRRYGPTARDHLRWRGLYTHGESVVLSYRVGDVDVLELPGAESFDGFPALTRTLDLGPRSTELVLQVAHRSDQELELRQVDDQELALYRVETPKSATPADASAVNEAAMLNFDGGTSLEVRRPEDFDFRADFSVFARLRTEEGGTILARAPRTGEWAPGGTTLFIRDGELCYDVGWVGVVSSTRTVNDGEWHDLGMTYQAEGSVVRFFIDGEPAGEGPLDPGQGPEDFAVRIGYTSENFPEEGGFVGSLSELRFYRGILEAEQLTSDTLPTAGLLSHWGPRTAGATRKDMTGGGHDARRRKIEGAGAPESFPLVFDGATHLEVSRSEEFDFTRRDYTIWARVKTEEGGTILSKAAAAGPWSENAKTFFIQDGHLAFDVGWVGVAVSQRAVNEGEWQDVAMTFDHDDGTVRFFIDGQPAGCGEDEDEDESDRCRLLPNDTEEKQLVRIGFTRPDFPEETPTYFEGRMAEVRVYSRALDAAEIRAIPEEETPADDLQAHWELLEYETATVPDAAEAGHHPARLIGSRQLPGLGRVPVVAKLGGPDDASWITTADGNLRLRIPAGEATRLKILYGMTTDVDDLAPFVDLLEQSKPADALEPLTQGGPRRWRRTMQTAARTRGSRQDPFAVDDLAAPLDNPYGSWLRFTGFDFFPDGRAALCTWMGDVWIVDGIEGDLGKVTWKRFATGLYQPLGLKIIDGTIHAVGRDQITRLYDLNGNGEADFYENLNNDAQATEHYHGFAMGLQTDAEGNFYYMKGGRHALDSVVAQHGTLMKVSKDGTRSEIVANGFRAPNGLCLNPDGSFITSDQEGHWTPANRINWVQPGGFYGYLWSYHRGPEPKDYARPLCWIDPEYDRSPGAQLWVRNPAWGALDGKLLSFSYGTGHILLVPHETVAGQVQGGVSRLPLSAFPTGIHRGRFHPKDGHLYVCGMFGWSSDRTLEGGFYRVRPTGQPVHAPVGLHATKSGVVIRFSDPLDKRRAADARRYSVERWNYKWAERYGSEDFRLSDGKIGRDRVEVTEARVSNDGRSVFLAITDMKPCMQMKIVMRSLRGENGSRVAREIYHSVHVLGPDEPHRKAFR